MNKKALETEIIPKIILYPALLILILLMMYLLIQYLYNFDLSNLFRFG